MVFPRSVVVAEGTACLDFLMPKRSGVDGKSAPSGGLHNGDLIIGERQRMSLLSRVLENTHAAFGIVMLLMGLTDKAVPCWHLAMMSCPVGRTLARSSTDSILSTNTG